MKRISRRDFTYSPSKYLVIGESFVITNRGKDELLVHVKMPGMLNTKEQIKEHLKGVEPQNPDDIEVVNGYLGKYGCGCSKVEGKNLCAKHARI